ncbi:hypothetical protein EVAR_11102_1 [Eumeta japonica]|uniref:Mariner Mos1 transposase n=1 Tax=Eumeta variegata TaxID=151549 RepID=A0A4C1U443_EUMVA|nr:hypothetical protein EVAR_11102_1 [Eumeta japonica]
MLEYEKNETRSHPISSDSKNLKLDNPVSAEDNIIGGENTEQLLGAPKLQSGTAINQGKAIVDVLNDWELTNRIEAICFDTTSVNTGDLFVKIFYQIETFQPRNDYKELLDLLCIFLGGTPPGGIKFKAPGAAHHARWLAKAIYCLKIYMFNKQFHINQNEVLKLRKALDSDADPINFDLDLVFNSDPGPGSGFCSPSSFQFRYRYQLLRKEKKNAQRNFEDMVSVLQESAPSYTMVKNGLAYFNKDERAVKMILRASCDGVHAMDEKGERPPKKFKVQKSASKLMATIFGIVKARRSYRSDVGSYRAECCFYKTMHLSTRRVSRQALKDTGFSEIDHPPYSPDLAPRDYFLFSNLKKELRGRRFLDDNQMKMAVESHFDCKEKEYFWAV